MMVFKICKCGETVGCRLGDYEDGDLIDHSGCKLKGEMKK